MDTDKVIQDLNRRFAAPLSSGNSGIAAHGCYGVNLRIKRRTAEYDSPQCVSGGTGFE